MLSDRLVKQCLTSAAQNSVPPVALNAANMPMPANDEKQASSSSLNPKTTYIVATGGTIAGTSSSPTSANYDAGKLSVKELITAIPDLKCYEHLEAIDLFQIDSSDITTEHWLTLAKKVNALLNLPDTKSVVITHGTDTLEETAYFLDLVIKSKKPVVLVGSMRAATSLSADGPLNLFNALAVANSPESVGRGVLVVMNDTVFDARDVTKTKTTQVNSFSSPNTGALAYVNYGVVSFEKQATRKNTIDTPFDVSQIDKLPEVEILYEYAGSSGKLLKAAIELNPDGIVIAGTGDGNIPCQDKALMKYARDKGIQIIRSSRTGSGRVTYDSVDQLDSEIGLIAGDNLTPQKARILLMLSLTQTKNVKEIRYNFGVF
jgi:L-asparaginase